MDRRTGARGHRQPVREVSTQQTAIFGCRQLQTGPLIQTQNHVSESEIRLTNPVKPVDLVVDSTV